MLAATPLQARTHHDSGSFSLLPQPLAVLATALDQLGRYEPAATISRFAATAFTKRAFPEIGSTIDHLREMLGDEAYEALASTGASMTNAAMTAIGENVTMTNLPSQGDPQLLSRWSDSRGAVGTGAV